MKKYTQEELQVTFEKKTILLNGLLIERQETDEETVKKLKAAHYHRLEVITKMEQTDEKLSLRLLNEEIERIDFELQKLWGFPENSNYHRWWEVPKCVCPKMDNRDNYGTKYRIIVENCPIHSLKKENEKST